MSVRRRMRHMRSFREALHLQFACSETACEAQHNISCRALAIMPVQTHSPYPLVSVIDAQQVVERESATLPAEEVDLSRAAGRVLAETVTAKDDLPPFPASIKVW